MECHNHLIYYDHCRRPLCRTLSRFDDTRCTSTAKFRGPAYALWVVLVYLERMAYPTTPRQREFAKRFKGSKGYGRAV